MAFSSRGTRSLESEDIWSIMPLVDSIHETKTVLKQYIHDIDSKLAQMAKGSMDLAIDTDYIGEFLPIQARAASMEALSARIFVWKEISSIVLIIPLICLEGLSFADNNIPSMIHRKTGLKMNSHLLPGLFLSLSSGSDPRYSERLIRRQRGPRSSR